MHSQLCLPQLPLPSPPPQKEKRIPGIVPSVRVANCSRKAMKPWSFNIFCCSCFVRAFCGTVKLSSLIWPLWLIPLPISLLKMMVFNQNTVILLIISDECVWSSQNCDDRTHSFQSAFLIHAWNSCVNIILILSMDQQTLGLWRWKLSTWGKKRWNILGNQQTQLIRGFVLEPESTPHWWKLCDLTSVPNWWNMGCCINRQANPKFF